VIVLAAAIAALAVGAATVLTLSSAANPKIVVSCGGNSCSVKLPGALLDEMNRTMTKSLSEPAESKTAGKPPATQHQATVEDPDAELLREVEKFFK
jgi:hypothetical protein